jgi:hypothetical protein
VNSLIPILFAHWFPIFSEQKKKGGERNFTTLFDSMMAHNNSFEMLMPSSLDLLEKVWDPLSYQSTLFLDIDTLLFHIEKII